MDSPMTRLLGKFCDDVACGFWASVDWLIYG
jgi:hypothetical protein